ncbi:hypothetical protein ACFWOL_34525 [Streptomyces sp. NPDC058442]|uniref:hypothetical protein n=1 Tax=Streptomyces sp. NPDC058442 TaxID=3346503 RepID=UPI00365649B7
MRIIEGSPQEIMEYERLVGVAAETMPTEDNAASPDEETEPARETAAPDGSASLSLERALSPFIYGSRSLDRVIVRSTGVLDGA